MIATLGKVLLGLWMIAIIIGTFTWLQPAVGFRNESMARILVFHVPNAIVASIVSFTSVYFAIVYLLKRRAIDDIRSHAAASLAILFWLLTTVTGMVFAKVEWGVPWNWDPKQAGTFLVLLIYVSYFALRSAFRRRDKAGRRSSSMDDICWNHGAVFDVRDTKRSGCCLIASKGCNHLKCRAQP